MQLNSFEILFLKDLKQFEGLELHPYNDSEGYATIGYGHLIARRLVNAQDINDWLGFNEHEAELLLIKDMRIHNNEALKKLPWIEQLDDVRKTVVFGMAFQMGIPTLLTFKNTLNSIKNGNYSDAAWRMGQSEWALEDSPNRAKILIERMRTGTFK